MRIMTGFVKAIPNRTRSEIQFINCWVLNLHSCTTQKHQAHVYSSQVCFHRWLFANPIKPPKCTTGSVGPVKWHEKGYEWCQIPANDCRSILWIEPVSVTDWRHSTAICVLMEGIICLRLPTYPHHPQHPL